MRKFQIEKKKEVLFNRVILSSNLFMNENATQNTMAKLSSFRDDSEILIINNAEPDFGITSVKGFQEQGFTTIHEITVSVEHLEEQIGLIKKADLVVLTGGNPWRLLQDLRQTNALYHIRDDATIIGVSAGAMVLGKDIEILDEFSPELNENGEYSYSQGYNLFDGKNIIPHCDEEEYFPKEKMDQAIGDSSHAYLFINKNDEIKESY